MEVVFKIVDTCNLNCTYCFYFKDRDRNFENRQFLMVSRQTIETIAQFLKTGCLELGIKELCIIICGGEPLLQKKQDFDFMCQHLNEVLVSVVNLKFAIITNGTLISADWVDLFEKYNITPIVSIDGPEEYHDKFRSDLRGLGTYKNVANGISLLQHAANRGTISKIHTHAVIYPLHSAKKIYRHFVDDLKLTQMRFPLPDLNHDTFPIYSKKYGVVIEHFANFMCELFDEWIKDNNEAIENVCNSCYFGFDRKASDLPNVFILYGNGRLALEDNHETTIRGFISSETNIDKLTMKEFLNLPMFNEKKTLVENIPLVCQDCEWCSICKAGRCVFVSRYSSVNSFDNPSVYCAALKKIYSHTASHMISHANNVKDERCSKFI